MTAIRPTAPLPAPLPYASQAGRGEVPVPPPALPVNPDGPVLREDDATLVACTAFVVIFIVAMCAIAAAGGL